MAYISRYDLRPPPLRLLLYAKLPEKAKARFHAEYSRLLELCHESTPSYSAEDAEGSSLPFHKLALLFPALILAPRSQEEERVSATALVRRRLASYRQGFLRDLVKELYSVKSWSPREKAERATERPADPSRIAQLQADNGNTRGAVQSLTSQQDRVLIEGAIEQKILTELYVKELPEQNSARRRTRQSTRAGSVVPDDVLEDLSEEDFLAAVRKIGTGKSGGPFAAVTDCLRNLAVHSYASSDGERHHPYLCSVLQYVGLLANNLVPDGAREAAVSVFFSALYKDYEKDKMAIRPLGIGTAYRRLVAAVMSRVYSKCAAEFLLPLNFGVGVKGGVDIAFHSIHAQCEQWVFRSVSELDSPKDGPSRCFVSLDMANMFNRMSRKECRRILEAHIPSLLPLFDATYGGTNTVWYQTPEGPFTSLEQEEGFAQGDPLAPLFASLVLQKVLQPIQDEQRARAKRRKSRFPGDDKKGGAASLGAYIDDAGSVVPWIDVYWLLQRFVDIGGPLGAHLNRIKTKILTGITGRSILPYLPSNGAGYCHATDIASDGTNIDVRAAVQLAIDEFTDGEETNGIKILGRPVGSRAFQQDHLEKFFGNYWKDSRAVALKHNDEHTVATLYSKSIISRVPFQLTADIMLNLPEDATDEDILHWKSPLTAAVDGITHRLFARFGSLDALPAHAAELLHLPQSKDGAGVMSPSTSAATSFVVPLIRTIRAATDGIKLGNSTVHLGYVVKSQFSGWRDDPRPTFKAFRRCASAIASKIHIPKKYRSLYTPLEYLVRFHPIDSLASYLCDKSAQLNYDSLRSGSRQSNPFLPVAMFDAEGADAAPSIHEAASLPAGSDWDHHFSWEDVAKAVPEILDSGILRGLVHTSRRNRMYRHSSDYFKLGLLRALRLPIFSSQRRPSCKCKAVIDIYGDHYFECAKHSKATMHNKVRDALYFVLRKLAPLSGAVYSKDDVLFEPQGLCRRHPLRRPADVAIRLADRCVGTSTRCQFRYAALDVTITRPPQVSATIPTQSSLIRSHMLKEVEKWRGASRDGVPGHEVIEDLLANDTVILPITVSPFGNIGPTARSFLFGDPVTPVRAYPIQSATNATFSMMARATSSHVPRDIMGRASQSWRHSQGSKWFGVSFSDDTPANWGRNALAQSIFRAQTAHVLHSMRRASADGVSNGTPPKNILAAQSLNYSIAASTTSSRSSAAMAVHNTLHTYQIHHSDA